MRKIYFLYFVALVFAKGFSQDPLFTNTSQSLMYLNPSFAGSNGGIRNQFSYRLQWPLYERTYTTYLNSFDAYIKSINGAVSVSVLRDDALQGQLKTDAINAVYAQYFSLFDGKLKVIPSLQVSYLRLTYDQTKDFRGDINPRFVERWIPRSISPSQRKSNYDISSGLLINYKNLYLGTSVFHINQPDQGLVGKSKLPYRLSIHSSYNLHLSEKTLINFFGRYERQDEFNMFQLNINSLIFKHLIIGIGGFHSYVGQKNFYFKNFTSMVNLGYRHNYFAIKVAFEIVSSSNTQFTSSKSFEVMLSFNLRNKEQRKILTNLERW